ncbi:MAG: hypothetical protein HY235_25355 [Acidobacteria bacterium]|nr:hypothetical protein [Acidobacteriota bacterium]
MATISSGFAAEPREAAPADLLVRAGRGIEQFVDEFSSVTCLEMVAQSKFTPQGKPLLERKSTFDYLILMQWIGGELNIEESRERQGRMPKESERPLLVTHGFSTLLLVFHPKFQQSFEFQIQDPEISAGRRLDRVRFSQVRGAPTPAVLQLRGRDYPLAWVGTAWIDPQSAAIVRIEAALQMTMDDIGLKLLNSEVHYGPVKFSGSPRQFWLPQSATIEAKTIKQHWRNVHRFVNYRQFSVDTSSRTELPK